MASGDYLVAPGASTMAANRPNYSYAKRAFLAGVAVAAVVCGVLLAAHKPMAPGDQALEGAYYAVAKPPAFNFNRELSNHAGVYAFYQSEWAWEGS
jgi:hypothetical protein